MRSTKAIQIVGCHAEGEVGDVIIGGVAPPPGDTIWEQSRFIAEDGTLRNFVLNEPRGGVFRHVNLVVPPKAPEAAFGFIIMEPEDTPPMSGSNCICVSTVLLDTGMIPMQEPETRFFLEAPAGLVAVRARCRNGKAESITLRNVPAFADRLAAPLEVEGIGTITVDTAFGGDSFVMADARSLGFSLEAKEARDLAVIGRRIVAAANEQLPFRHPVLTDWSHYSFCFLTGPLENRRRLRIESQCLRHQSRQDRPFADGHRLFGTDGRTPCQGTTETRGIAISGARSSRAGSTAELRKKSIWPGKAAIIPEITGRAWITDQRTLLLDPDDPWPQGYKLSDTWPLDG